MKTLLNLLTFGVIKRYYTNKKNARMYREMGKCYPWSGEGVSGAVKAASYIRSANPQRLTKEQLKQLFGEV